MVIIEHADNKKTLKYYWLRYACFTYFRKQWKNLLVPR